MQTLQEKNRKIKRKSVTAITLWVDTNHIKAAGLKTCDTDLKDSEVKSFLEKTGG